MKKLILTLFMACCGLLVNAQTPDELFISKEYVKAADAYSAVVKTEPQNVQALRRLAFCYMNMPGYTHLASIYFEKALKVDAKDLASNYYLGVLYKEAAAKAEAAKVANLKSQAKRYLQAAADMGSEDAKAELRNL